MTPNDLKVLLERMGWTQAQFARATEFTPEHVSRMIHGTKAITRVTELACRALEAEK